MPAKPKTTRKPRKSAKVAPKAAEIPAPVRLSSQDREAVAADVLDLVLLLLQRRLRDEPETVKASGIAETTKLLGLFYRYRDKLDKGAGDDGWQDYIKGLPSYADHDEDDPMLQGNHGADGHHEAPVVTPEDLARLADFDHD